MIDFHSNTAGIVIQSSALQYSETR
jgi:hypothetical protein